MRRRSFDSWPCSIARTVEIVGDAWTMLVIRELFYGQTRFDQFVESLGIARNTLTDRLALLVRRGLVERRRYQVEPERHEYILSAQGRDFFGVLVAMNAWGDRWLSSDDGVPIVLRHESCGHDLQAQVVCSSCGRDVDADEVTLQIGAGYPAKLADRADVAARFGHELAPR